MKNEKILLSCKPEVVNLTFRGNEPTGWVTVATVSRFQKRNKESKKYANSMSFRVDRKTDTEFVEINKKAVSNGFYSSECYEYTYNIKVRRLTEKAEKRVLELYTKITSNTENTCH